MAHPFVKNKLLIPIWYDRNAQLIFPWFNSQKWCVSNIYISLFPAYIWRFFFLKLLDIRLSITISRIGYGLESLLSSWNHHQSHLSYFCITEQKLELDFTESPPPSGFRFQSSNERHLPEIWKAKDKDKPLISRDSYVQTCRLVSEVTLEMNFSLTS